MRGGFSASNARRAFDVVHRRFWTVVELEKALLAIFMIMGMPLAPISRVSSSRIALEHQVTAEDAMISALGIVPELMVNPGCKECSKSNETYCLGNDVIYDHCCCDRRFHESIPYVEHSCYIETTPCIPIVRDCGEYMKMMSCCCHRLLGTKWKNISMALAGESKLGSSLNVLVLSTALVFSTQRGIL